MKRLLTKAKASNQDPYLSLLSYRNTPFQQMGSPAQLLMNRRLRANQPTHHKKLLPKHTDLKATKKALEQRKLEQNDTMTAQQKNYHLYTRMTQSECPMKGSGNQQ